MRSSLKTVKTDDFRHFWPGLTDAAADCSAPCGPIQPKFYVVDGIGYGHKFHKCRARSTHRGRSNLPWRRSTRAKNGENHRFLTVFQLLRSRTLTHPNKFQIICGHTLSRLPRKILAGSAHRGPSNRLRRRSTRPKNGENHRFLMVFQLLFNCPTTQISTDLAVFKDIRS